MEEAIAAVTGGLMSVREAARKHGVARTTLQRKLSRAAGAPASSQATSPASDSAPMMTSASGPFLAVAGDADERGAAAQLGVMASGEMLKLEREGDGTSYSSGTSSPSDADYAQEQSPAGRKRSAEQMERSSLSKGACNC